MTKQQGGPAGLGRTAKAWRVVHGAWSVAQLAGLVTIWRAVLDRHRSPKVWASVLFLLVEGGALVVGHGNCPMGTRQARWGDSVPFFELFLPKRAAKAAIPVLAAISVTGIGGLALRRPRLALRAS